VADPNHDPPPARDAEEPVQLNLFPGADPDELIARARERWRPIVTYCMLSGGNDSVTVAHHCREHYDALFHIDTATGIEEDENFSVKRHVRSVADWLKKPLVIIPAGRAYEQMVLGGHRFTRGERAGQIEPGNGLPGPGMHGKAYTRLKERQIEELVRRAKRGQHREASVLLLSGVRRAESRRRSKRMPLTEHGSAKYVNPLIDWNALDMRGYRQEHGLPESEVANVLHRSGECQCGAFADAASERPLLEVFFPRSFARIAALERRAEAQGLRWCRWGGYDLNGVRSTDKSEETPGPACAGCAAREQLDLLAA
jgi:3'-phosphoadenosine 5'-phosphosulfate sulfotransferase (PAPS reductase)/FAD synthetase